MLLDRIFSYFSSNFLMAGNLNGHHPAWRPAPPSSRDVLLHNSIVSHGFCILNDGSPSRINRPPYNNTTFHITICSPNNSISMSLKTISDSFGSDHLPIIISCPLSSSPILPSHPSFPVSPGFNLNKAN